MQGKTTQELSRDFDLRSTEDQIKKLYQQAHDLQIAIDDIKLELDSKVDLISRSQSLNSVTTSNTIGSGVISSTGISDGTSITFSGIGTYFTSEIAAANVTLTNYAIRLGAVSYPIISINNDSSLTVSGTTNISAFTEQFYSIVKPVTAEQLVGDYEFGVLNGKLFNGRINQKSILSHYGRMADPYDVVNVQYVKNATYPILVKALQAIKRIGDSVGINSTTGTTYSYTYHNCCFDFDNSVTYGTATTTQTAAERLALSTFNFNTFTMNYRNCAINLGTPDATSDVRYYGPIAVNANIVTKEYADNRASALYDSIIFKTGIVAHLGFIPLPYYDDGTRATIDEVKAVMVSSRQHGWWCGEHNSLTLLDCYVMDYNTLQVWCRTTTISGRDRGSVQMGANYLIICQRKKSTVV